MAPHTALVLAGAAVLASTLLLALLTAEAGLETRWKDQRHYLASAWHLAHGQGLVMPELEVGTGRVAQRPLTSFPPLLPVALALVMAAGCPPEAAPTVVSLLAWPWLLAGIGLLARRLGATPAAAALATVVAAVTWPYWNVHVEIQSEALFLPLLVWTVLLLHGLPWRHEGFAPRFAAALVLLALLLLTRYTGMFVYLPVVGWWLVARGRQRRWRRLAAELALFALAAVPFLLWLARNTALTGGLFGPVLLSETLGVGPGQVLASVVTQSTWLVLPAVRPGPLWRQWGLGAALPVLALAAWGAWAAWGGPRGEHRRRAAHDGGSTPSGGRPVHPARDRWMPASPLLPFLVFYLGFLVLAPLFMRMQGMIERYMAVILCLAQPWLAALVSRRSGAGGTAFLATFAAANLVLLAAAAGSAAPPGGWLHLAPPRSVDLAGRPTQAHQRLLAGAPAWLVHRPPRTGDLRRHLPHVAALLEAQEPRAAVVSNAPDLFLWHPLLPAGDAVETWLAGGTCRPRHPVAVVVVDWDRWQRGVPEEAVLDRAAGDPAALRRRVAARCPGIVPVVTPRAAVWLLTGEAAP